jgi:hypothetical protein
MPFLDSEVRRQYINTWQRNNRQKTRCYAKRLYNRNRKFLRNLRKNSKCARCGEPHWACLDFHHIDPSTKSFSVNMMGGAHSIKRIQEEIAKCIVLCSNCHRKEHAPEDLPPML